MTITPEAQVCHVQMKPGTYRLRPERTVPLPLILISEKSSYNHPIFLFLSRFI